MYYSNKQNTFEHTAIYVVARALVFVHKGYPAEEG